MRKVLLISSLAASAILLAACGQKTETPTGPTVDTPPPAETLPAPLPEGTSVVFDTDKAIAEEWTVRNGTATAEAEGVRVTLAEDGSAFLADNATPVVAGDTFTAKFSVNSAAEGKVRIRIQSHCGAETTERGFAGLDYGIGSSELEVSYTFENAHPCARVQFDPSGGPVDFTVTDVMITKTEG